MCPALASALLLLLAGCGGDPPSPAVVRVGHIAITKAAVEHWADAMRHGAGVGGAYNEPHRTPRQNALVFLIRSAWLRGEAASQGVSPSDAAVGRAFEDRREANGAGEFDRSLHASGQTVADVKLELQAELAARAIRQKVLDQVPAVGQAEVRDFYRTHRRLFLISETRTVELVENLPSPQAARALVQRIGTGPSFSKKALHEQLQINRGERLYPDIEHVTHAIFRAPVGVASAPMSLNGRWTVFVVRKVVPASYKPLASVRSEIAAHLAKRRRAAALTDFIAAYRKRWTAQTSCRPADVVQGCSQYTGPALPEPNPLPGE
jgi:parvulin-like peptidyl-prolyl cis-trans isomerase-like protein